MYNFFYFKAYLEHMPMQTGETATYSVLKNDTDGRYVTKKISN